VAALIRGAVPGDVETLSRIIDLAGRAWIQLDSFEGEQKEPLMATIFPGPERERFEKTGAIVLKAERYFMHYSRFRVAEVDGRIAGGLCTHTKGEDSLAQAVRALRVAGCGYPEIAAVVHRCLPYLRACPSKSADALVVESVATFPEFRRMGVATALIEDVIDRARSEGFPLVQLAVFIGNVSAQSTYEKAGFRVDRQLTNRGHEKRYGSPGCMRLTLELPQETPGYRPGPHSATMSSTRERRKLRSGAP